MREYEIILSEYTRQRPCYYGRSHAYRLPVD